MTIYHTQNQQNSLVIQSSYVPGSINPEDGHPTLRESLEWVYEHSTIGLMSVSTNTGNHWEFAPR